MKIPKMNPTTKFFALTAVAAFLLSTFTGCGTIHGFGRDVKHTGEHIQAGSQ